MVLVYTLLLVLSLPSSLSPPSPLFPSPYFLNLSVVHIGTEGTCFKAFPKCSGRLFALKRARVYPEKACFSYYMIRELSFLEYVSLRDDCYQA